MIPSRHEHEWWEKAKFAPQPSTDPTLRRQLLVYLDALNYQATPLVPVHPQALQPHKFCKFKRHLPGVPTETETHACCLQKQRSVSHGGNLPPRSSCHPLSEASKRALPLPAGVRDDRGPHLLNGTPQVLLQSCQCVLRSSCRQQTICQPHQLVHVEHHKASSFCLLECFSSWLGILPTRAAWKETRRAVNLGNQQSRGKKTVKKEGGRSNKENTHRRSSGGAFAWAG